MGIAGKLIRAAGRLIPPGALAPAGQPVALFFHGVEPERGDPLLQTNHHTVADFRAILSALKGRFDVLPLTAIDAVLAEPERHRRSVFLMSDDGYRNTLDVAADILADFDFPWTLFVSTEHIDKGRANPAFMAWVFFMKAPPGTYTLPHFDQPVVLRDAKSRAQSAFQSVDHLRFLPAEKAEEALAAMVAAFAPDALPVLLDQFASEKFLDWEGVRALHRRGVVIGAHADSHWPMHAGQSQAYLARQAAHARVRIEEEVGPCRFFAYPFGNRKDVGKGAWQAVRDAGFTHGFTTLSGTLAAGGNPWLLPRYGLGPRDTHIASLIPLLFTGNPRLLAWQRGLA